MSFTKRSLLAGLSTVALGAIASLRVLTPKPVPVEVFAADHGLVEQTVTNSRAGTVRSLWRARLSPEVGGRIVELAYRKGDSFEADDVLLRLDDRSERAQLLLSRSEVKAAEAKRQQSCLAAGRALRKFERIHNLATEGIVSASFLDSIETDRLAADAACEAANARVARAEAAVESWRTELEKTVLRAPFGGVIAELAGELGEWAVPTPAIPRLQAVIEILDPESIYFSAFMDEVDSQRIHVGQAARVTVHSHRSRSFLGRVSLVAPFVLDLQEQNRVLAVAVDLLPSQTVPRLLPGTSADVEIVLESHAEALRVPTSALRAGNRIFVLEKGMVTERRVHLGLANWNHTEILGGLEQGELVILSLDRPEIRPGLRAFALTNEGPSK